MKKRASKHKKRRFFEKRDWLFLCITVSLNILLSIFGFGWGMDGYVPWEPDAIEGITVLREMPKLYGQWDYKYPRLQFLIDGTCYKPLIEEWKRFPVYENINGQTHSRTITPQRLQELAKISRINVLVMSAMTIVFVYLSGRFYYSSSLAGFSAAICTTLTYIFVFYSHTTCVDIPSMLWITAGFYFLLRSTVLNRLVDHLMMAIMFAFACATKDPMLFYSAAFAVVYAGLRFRQLFIDSHNWKMSLLGLLNRNTLLSTFIFVFLFAILQNIIPWPGAYWERMGVWVGGRGVKDFNQGFVGHIPLLISTLKQFYWAMGWPLIVMLLISLGVTMRKHLVFNLLAILFPLVFFYIFVTMQIKMSYIRYYLPIMGILYLPVGCLVRQVYQQRKLWSRAVLGGIGTIWLLTALYCAALDYELIADSRNKTADWFVQNVKKDTVVLSCIRRPYGPKLNKYGYRLIENWNVPPLPELLAHQDRLPEYVVVSSNWMNLKNAETQAFCQALLNGQTKYTKAAAFYHNGLLNPKRNWMSLACWPFMPGIGVSPEVHIMKRNENGHIRVD